MAISNSMTHLSYMKEYRAWRGMQERCGNPKSKAYKDYGGRGISVCERWKASFRAFFEDVGAAPSLLHSIDRIDVNGNYEPGNVRWATRLQQTLNRRVSKFPEYPRKPHKASGQARIKVEGKHVYLGKFDTKASCEKYMKLKKQWQMERIYGVRKRNARSNVSEASALYFMFDFGTFAKDAFVEVDLSY